ncbi:5'/3'-nucleotidase SurE [Ignavigranum ruoffiae]|uniref:5'/3'-nucleotidase SurE n=1 Tax=Ignavigranum ruoffiae TaxID=89093 RepID=UPI00205BD508|nr:5'/3'-nucleotidase SurE [Ignavigranum ruoffiae]UPQ86448.1 5'/3'-nucleotidase SurE [Ignavigranum ruoffiae]
MKLLISNDDGIDSLGLYLLAEVLKDIAEIIVVAPDSQRSGASHSITLDRPLRAQQVDLMTGVTSFKVNGSPVDCLKLGIEHLSAGRPDLVISGINAGANLGQDLCYSGTLAIAREANLYQIPALALSMARSNNHQVNFGRLKPFLQQNLGKLLPDLKNFAYFLNVNLPSMEHQSIQGIKVVPMDLSIKKFDFKVLKDPKDRDVYWLRNLFQEIHSEDIQNDYHFVKSGYVTVSPLSMMSESINLVEPIQKYINEKEII